MANEYYVPLAQNAAQPGTTVRSAQFNENNNAIESGFEQLPSPLALFSGTTNFAISTGSTPNEYLIDINPDLITSYNDGLTIQFRAHQDNTGAVQVNVNSIGLRQVRTRRGLQLNADDILQDGIVVIRYNATTGLFNVDDAVTEINAFVQNAEDARDLAQQWAENPEDTPVTPGNFSALHHAIKAAASDSAAANSATNAANSASSAAGSATTATQRATEASNSATAAANSASSAAASATTATQQATAASNSATAASNSATAADTSRQQAQSAASTATTQANNAQSSAGAAATSATNAANSATSANNSRQAAATSATNANNSANTATTQANRAESEADRAEDAAGIAEDAVRGVIWSAQDGDSTVVNIEKEDFLRFQAGAGMQVNFTDTNGGSSSDPFDLQFTVTDAPQLRTARTISLSGDASGSASFDGSQNITITVTVANNSHSHTISNITGLQAALDARMQNFTLEDGDGTFVTMMNANRVKFVEGTGIDINFTDTSPGTPSDPFDLQFSVTSAPRLTTTRNIALTGEVVGNASFNGASDISINASLNINQLELGSNDQFLIREETSGNTIYFGADSSIARQDGRPWRIVGQNKVDGGDMFFQRASQDVVAGGAVSWVSSLILRESGVVGIPGFNDLASSLNSISSTANSAMQSFTMEDGDGTVVTINDGNRFKFVEAGGININLTDTSPGTPADPFDVSFSITTATDSSVGGARFSTPSETRAATSTRLIVSPNRMLDSIQNSGAIREAIQDLVGDLAEGNNTNITVTYDDANAELEFSVANSSEIARGVSELATNDETALGADTSRVITPSRLRFALFNGQIRADLNNIIQSNFPNGFNSINTYAMVRYTGSSNQSEGASVSGSELAFANATGNGNTVASGTWRLMGPVTTASLPARTTIAIRIG